MSMTNMYEDIPRQAERIARRYARRWWPVWAYPGHIEITRRTYEHGWVITVRVRTPPHEKPAEIRRLEAEMYRRLAGE